MIAGENAESAGINRNRFMQTEFGGKIGDWVRPQHACVVRPPGAIGLEIFLLAPVSVIDPAVQHELPGPALDPRQRHLAKQRDWIVIELAPARRVEVEEHVDRVLIPTPPEIARQGPEPLLKRRDEARQSARFGDHRRKLRGGLGHHVDFEVSKTTILDGLDDQDTLQNSPIDERDAEERLVSLFAGFFKIFEARMVSHLLHRDRAHFLRHQAGKPFMDRHAQGADTLGSKSKRGGQDQVGAIRLE